VARDPRGVRVLVDVNYRASLWAPADARLFLDAVLPEVRYLFLGHAEARTIFSLTGTAERRSRRWRGWRRGRR